MSDRFYNWLARKYSWGEESFEQFEEEFRNDLVREFCSITESY